MLGIATGLYATLVNFYAYSQGFHRTGAIKGWQLSGYLIQAGLIFLAVYWVKKSQGNQITFMRSMFTGLVLSVVAGLTSGIGNSIYFNLVNPEIKTELLTISERMIVQQKDSAATNFDEYEKIVAASFDSVTMTAEERTTIPQKAAADSSKEMRAALTRVEKGFSVSQMMIGQTMITAILGIILSLFAAAWLVNRRGQ